MSDAPEHPDGKKPKRDVRRDEREWARFSQLAFELIGYLGVLGYAGWWLDERYGTGGRYLFWGLLLGLAGWVYRFIKDTWHLFK